MPPARITLALVSPLAETLRTPGWLVKKSMTAAGCFGGSQQIDVADDLLATAQAARRAATHHVGMAAQAVQDRFRHGQGVAQQMARGVLAAELDALQNLGLGLFAEAVQLRDFAVLAGLLQLFHRFDAELVVERLDFFRTQAGNAQHRDQARRDGGLEFLVIGQFAGGDQFGDFFLEAVADALDALGGFGGEDLSRWPRDGFQRAGGVDVGARFERVFALEFEQRGDLRQNFRDLVPSS